MSISAMASVWQMPSEIKLTSAELITLLAIADRCNDDWICWPGQESLAKKVRLSPRHLRRVLDSLESQGFLEITSRPGEGGGRKTNVYKLLISCEKQRQPDMVTDRGNRTFLEGNRTQVSSNTSDKPKDTTKGGDTPKGVDPKAWRLWTEYRTSKQRLRDSWSPRAQQIAATRLRKLTPEAQLRCVEDGIQSGWKGIYEEKYHGTATQAPPGPPKRRSAIEACRSPHQLAALCQAAGIGLPPPGYGIEESKVWAIRKLGAPA